MESVDTFVGDSTESETESRIINDVKYQNQNVQMSNRSSAQTTFINHERKRSITSNVSNSDNVMSRSSFSSNDDVANGPRRPNQQEVRLRLSYRFLLLWLYMCLCLVLALNQFVYSFEIKLLLLLMEMVMIMSDE